MNRYCELCGKDVKTKIVSQNETYKVCGENIDVACKVLVCSECGEEIFDEELDSSTLVTAYNEYRRRHKLLLPEEIREIREQYGLSQRSFGKLLNWGDKTICRYENGSIQDRAHNSLLVLLRDPKNMEVYLSENEVMLDEKKKVKLLEQAKSLRQNVDYCVDGRVIETTFNGEPSIENGFKSFDYEKTCAMVLFFAHRCKGLPETKLMKLLNYSDMIYFKENGVSISGMKYACLPYGPVPDQYETILRMLNADHVVRVEVEYANGYEKHEIIPEKDYPEEILSEAEIEILERIYKKFKNFGSKKISEYSHREKGYASAKVGEIISYEYAKDIVGI